MSNDPVQQALATQLKNIEDKYGKKMDEWKSVLEQSGFEKHGELVNHLKEKYGITHGNANMIVHSAKQSHAAAAEDQDTLITDQYKGKESLKPMYEKLVKAIKSFGSDIEFSPKKTYVSVRRKKQFAIIQPTTKTRMDIGLNIKNELPLGKVELAGTWNSMCTHRIKAEKESDIDDNVIAYIRKAYEKAE